MTLHELLGLAQQYLKDAGPGGELNREVTPQGVLDVAALSTAPVPLLGDGVGLAADLTRYANEPAERTPGNFAMTALGALPFVPALSTKKAAGKAKDIWDRLPPLPWAAERYPQTSVPVLGFDKKKKEGEQFFAEKQMSAEADQIAARRKAAQQEIDKAQEARRAGKDTSGFAYEPYFDTSKRYYADPANYPLEKDTQIRNVKQTKAGDKAIAAAREKWQTPENAERLRAALKVGAEDADAIDWYAMGQLENEFVKRLGVEPGRAAFKERFADAMAATTGGAAPDDNLLTAALGNYYKTKGADFPRNRDNSVASFDLPYPVGGRYVGGNIEKYDSTVMKGRGLDADNEPKRHNFSANFMGHKDPKTIDEQMMAVMRPTITPEAQAKWDAKVAAALAAGKKAPEPKVQAAPTEIEYPIIEAMVKRIEAEQAVPLGNTQDVIWAGGKAMKDAAKGKKRSPSVPMIEQVNQMLWRGHRVHGKTQDEVLDGFIRGNMPMYGMGAAAIGAPLLFRIAAGLEEQQAQ